MSELDRVKAQIEELRRRLHWLEDRKERIERAQWETYMRERNNWLAQQIPAGTL